MSDRRGLPAVKKMRHDAHFVDTLANRYEETLGRKVPIDRIVANPLNPRMEIGDIEDLVASVREHGVLQPLLVTPLEDGRFQLLAGERRFRASQKAGLKEVPVVEMEEEDDEGMLVVALIENLQRKDLTAFEEADGLKLLADRFEYTHDEIAKRIGKKRSTVTETLRIAAIPPEIRRLCEKAGITTRTLLVQIAREDDPNRMLDVIDRIAAGESIAREELARRRREQKGEKPAGRPRFFAFSFRPKESNFSLSLRFRKARVSREEIIQALREAIERLQREKE